MLIFHIIPKLGIDNHFSTGYNKFAREPRQRCRGNRCVIGANLDPSHLIWQGIDPVAATRALAGAIYHVHAKDTKVDAYNTAINGVLDTKHYSDELHRAWVFRTVGYGNGETYWRDFVSNLRLCGYDRVLSIEHEDSIMTIDEGLRKAVDFINKVIITEEKPRTMSWS